MMEGWKKLKIKDFAKTTSGGTPSRINKDFFRGKILWVKSGELNDNYIFDTEEKITDDAINKSSAKLFSQRDNFSGMYGTTVGKTAILKNEATTNQAICGIFSNYEIFDNYLEAYGLEIGLLINFRNTSLQFKRVMKPNKSKSVK